MATDRFITDRPIGVQKPTNNVTKQAEPRDGTHREKRRLVVSLVGFNDTFNTRKKKRGRPRNTSRQDLKADMASSGLLGIN